MADYVGLCRRPLEIELASSKRLPGGFGSRDVAARDTL